MGQYHFVDRSISFPQSHCSGAGPMQQTEYGTSSVTGGCGDRSTPNSTNVQIAMEVIEAMPRPAKGCQAACTDGSAQSQLTPRATCEWLSWPCKQQSLIQQFCL